MKIVFFGTSPVANPILSALHTAHEILTVVTAPDAPVGRKQIMTPSSVALVAAELTIPLLKPANVKKNVDIVQTLQACNADIFIVVSYGKILPREIISLPRLKTLNVHFSRLPLYRGAAPIQYALLNGDTKTATTIFVLDEHMDHGPIVAQEETVIEPHDTFQTLASRMADQSAALLLKTLPDYEAGTIIPQEQDHARATPTGIIKKSDGKVDWNRTATQIYNQFRAFNPWPGIWTTWAGKIVKINACGPVKNAGAAIQPSGTVFVQDNVLVVQCGNATRLELREIQLEGKNKMPGMAFINGHPQLLHAIFE